MSFIKNENNRDREGERDSIKRKMLGVVWGVFLENSFYFIIKFLISFFEEFWIIFFNKGEVKYFINIKSSRKFYVIWFSLVYYI